MNQEPGEAAAFLVLRAWTDDEGSATEQWRLESPAGQVVYEGTSREIHLPTRAHVEELRDEIADLEVEYAADNYTAVFYLDENEVGRVDFPVRVGDEPRMEA